MGRGEGLKVNRINKEGRRTYYFITIPPDIGDVIPPEMEFRVEMTEEGLLYRPITVKINPPKWAKG